MKHPFVATLLAIVASLSALAQAPFSATLQSESGALVLRWPSDSGQHYHVESSPDLTTWTAEPGDFVGTGTELTSVVRPAGAVDPTRQFWRVVAEDVPPISLSLVAHRTAGVAPLSVFFDATSTTATATARPFHDLEYRWDFGDPLSGPWTEGVNAATSSKNRATGAVTAHVFERPGTYTVRLTATDGTHTATRTTTITVDDPDLVFATKTTCIAASGTDPATFAGAPAGATLVTNPDFPTAVRDALAAGARRILFRRGNIFTAATRIIHSAQGPVLIGAFGSGARPVVQLTSGEVTAVEHWAVSDWRVMDLEIDGQSNPGRAVSVSGQDFTALRIYSHEIGMGFGLGGRHLSVVDCKVQNIVGGAHGYMGMYVQDAFGLFVAGSSIDNGGVGEYVLRYQGGTHGVISHNRFLRCGDNKCTFTLRGDSTQTNYVARYHMLTDNLFDASTSVGLAFVVTINPQNGGRNEQIADVVVERNHIIGNPGGMNLLNITASDVTVRNNLFDATATGIGPVILLTYGNNTGGLPAPARNHIYHNTIFSNAANGLTAVAIYQQGLRVVDTVVRNNFYFAPYAVKTGRNNGFGLEALYDQGTNTIALANSTDAQAKSASPNLIAFPPLVPTDWALAPGCYGIGAGVPVPVWSDFFETPLAAAGPRNFGAVAK